MKKFLVYLFVLYAVDSFSQTADKNSDLVYDVTGIDLKPEYPDGLDKLNAYLTQNIPATNKREVPAKIFAVFIVEKDGSLSDVKIYGKVDSNTSDQLVSKLKNTSKWQPGIFKGGAVRVMYSLPIVKN